MADDSVRRDEVELATRAYADKLTEHFKRLGPGVSRNELARSIHVSASVVSRYLNGQRVAPSDFLDDFAEFLADRGAPIDDAGLAELEELREEAQATSRWSGNQLAYWKDQAQALAQDKTNLEQQAREAHKQSKRDRQAAAEALADLDQELAELREELQRALAGTTAAEASQEELQSRVDEQQRQLEHATSYTQELEGEAHARQEEMRLLKREVEVLHRQVKRLQQESAPPRLEAVPGTAPLLSAVTIEANTAVLQDTQSAAPRSPERPAARPVTHRSVGEPVPEPWSHAPRGVVITAHVTSVLPPVVSPVVASGFIAGIEASPGPAIWKLVLYFMVSLGGLIVFTLFVTFISLGSLDDIDSAMESNAGGCVLVVALWGSALFGVGALILGLFGLLPLGGPGRWFADAVGLL